MCDRKLSLHVYQAKHMGSLPTVQQGMIGQSRMPESNASLPCV